MPKPFFRPNAQIAVPLLVISGLASCAGPRSTVGDGVFQKRRHQPGWHVDLGQGKRATPNPKALPEQDQVITASVRDRPIHMDVAPPADTTALRSTIVPEPVVLASMEQDMQFLANTFQPIAIPQEPSNPDRSSPRATWNPWAVPAFAAALGTVAYGFLGTSGLVLLAAVILTLVLAVIAVRRGRMNEWRGKGFAIAALALGSLAALVTLIALLNSGL